MKQFIEEFKKGGIAVKFNNENEVNQFLSVCDGFGITWHSGKKTNDLEHASVVDAKCVIFLARGIVSGSESHCESICHKIVNFADINNSKSIHITMHANTIHAVLKENDRVIKHKKAVCNESDDFDFEYGARLAFDRLFNKVKEVKEVKEVKRKAEIGEYIKIVDEFLGVGEYEDGDILRVKKNYDFDGVCCESVNVCIYKFEYIVLENYKPKQKEMTIEEIEQKLGYEIKVVK